MVHSGTETRAQFFTRLRMKEISFAYKSRIKELEISTVIWGDTDQKFTFFHNIGGKILLHVNRPQDVRPFTPGACLIFFSKKKKEALVLFIGVKDRSVSPRDVGWYRSVIFSTLQAAPGMSQRFRFESEHRIESATANMNYETHNLLDFKSNPYSTGIRAVWPSCRSLNLSHTIFDASERKSLSWNTPKRRLELFRLILATTSLYSELF